MEGMGGKEGVAKAKDGWNVMIERKEIENMESSGERKRNSQHG